MAILLETTKNEQHRFVIFSSGLKYFNTRAPLLKVNLFFLQQWMLEDMMHQNSHLRNSSKAIVSSVVFHYHTVQNTQHGKKEVKKHFLTSQSLKCGHSQSLKPTRGWEPCIFNTGVYFCRHPTEQLHLLGYREPFSSMFCLHWLFELQNSLYFGLEYAITYIIGINLCHLVE